MTNVLAIAHNTFREALRNKVLYIIVFFLLGIIGLSVVLGSISFDEHDRIIKGFGHFAITILGLLVAMFVGVNMICEELDRRTIYTIIGSGVRRHEFIVGKFLGLFYVVVLNAVIMMVILYLILFLAPLVAPGIELFPTLSFAQAVIMSLFEMMVIIAFAVLFSSFSTPILSAMLTLFVWVLGRGAESLLDYQRMLRALDQGSPLFLNFLNGLYYALPNLAVLNQYGQEMTAQGVLTNYTAMASDAGIAVLYSALVLVAACIVFGLRDIK